MSKPGPEHGFTFPAALEVSAIGATDAALERVVPEILAAAGVRAIDGSLRTRASSGGRFVSVTVAFDCPDRETYDRVQEGLRAHPAVRWTL